MAPPAENHNEMEIFDSKQILTLERTQEANRAAWPQSVEAPSAQYAAKWIDTHTHHYDLPTREERQACWQRAVDAGVTRMIQGGVDRRSIAPIARFCAEHPGGVFATLGLHPTEVFDNYEAELELMEAVLDGGLAGLWPAVAGADAAGEEAPDIRYVGIGEIGLDFYHDRRYGKEQAAAFRRQIAWARGYGLPLVLHIRSAFEEACKILKEEQDGCLRGVFHCFGGSLEQARRAIDLGFHLGIGGVLTFKNAHLAETVAEVDLEHIVLETDAPYLAPHPYRGQPNESRYIPLIGQKLAEIKGCSVEHVASVTTRNAVKLFGL